MEWRPLVVHHRQVQRALHDVRRRLFAVRHREDHARYDRRQRVDAHETKHVHAPWRVRSVDCQHIAQQCDDKRPYLDNPQDLMPSDCVTIVSTAALCKKGMPLKIKIQGKMETLLPLDGKQFTNGEINCFMEGYRDPNTKFPMVKVRFPGDRRWDLHPHPPAEYKPHVPKIRKLLILDEDEQDDTYKDAEKDLKTSRFLDKLYGTQKHVPPTGRELKILGVEELMVMHNHANTAAKIFNSRIADILADGKNCSDSEDMEGTYRFFYQVYKTHPGIAHGSRRDRKIVEH
jgi:hypothetical protein